MIILGDTAQPTTTPSPATTPAWPPGPRCSGRMVPGPGSGAQTWRWGLSTMQTGDRADSTHICINIPGYFITFSSMKMRKMIT